MINRDRLINNFIELVRIDSPSGEERAVTHNVFQRLESLGIKSEIDQEGNLYAFIEGTGEPVVLNAHFDTVEPGRGVCPKIEQGIIRSDGTTVLGADNKAALAAILETLAVFHEQKIAHRPIEIVFSVKEETASGIKQFDFGKLVSKEGYCFDSSGPIGNVVTTAAYITEFAVKINGKAAHAGIEPEKGINALTIAAKAIAGLRWGRIDENTTANIGLISGGEAVNTVPREIKLKGDVRSLKQEKHDLTLQQIQTMFQQEAALVEGSIEMQAFPYCNGYSFAADSALVQKSMKVLESIGKKPNLINSNGGADANVFNSRGIRMLNFGYGACHIHTVSEEIEISDLVDLAKVILNLTGQE